MVLFNMFDLKQVFPNHIEDFSFPSMEIRVQICSWKELSRVTAVCYNLEVMVGEE